MGPNPGKELIFRDRFGQVIIGTGLESLYQVGNPVFGREHDYGKLTGRKSFTEFPTDLESRFLRHHNIEQDQIGHLPFIQCLQCFDTIGSGPDTIILKGEVIGNDPQIDRFIIHYKDNTLFFRSRVFL